MSCRDRTTGAARPWRLLTRALVVVGATAAGTSAAWLIGTGLPADAANLAPAAPADESAAPPESTNPPAAPVEGAATERSGPAEFSLGRLNPVELVRSGPAEQLLDAARPVTGVLQESADGVGHVADDALSATGAQAGEISTSVDNGLGGLGGPLLSGETGPQQGFSPTAPLPQAAPASVAAPVVPQPAQLVEHQRSAEQTESVTGPRAPEPAEAPGNPGWPRPFALPTLPGAPGCGGTGDGQQHNTAAVGCYPAEPDRTPAYAGASARDIASTLISAPEPQPGTTPD
ncbi:hypothetical protein AB0I53_00825 [Saccharopolyspora sp. NPDC050389]|uniref:hypothetical protein n=1 Tax=Saccharopolyspora sp. NPDC050389 TaxID=3155516 RepID=UPI0033D3EFB7